MSPPERPITAREAAAILGVDESTISRYATTGILPSKRLPTGARRFKRGDVEALLTQDGDVPEAAEVEKAYELVVDNIYRLSPGQRIRLASSLTTAMTSD